MWSTLDKTIMLIIATSAWHFSQLYEKVYFMLLSAKYKGHVMIMTTKAHELLSIGLKCIIYMQ